MSRHEFTISCPVYDWIGGRILFPLITCTMRERSPVHSFSCDRWTSWFNFLLMNIHREREKFPGKLIATLSRLIITSRRIVWWWLQWEREGGGSMTFPCVYESMSFFLSLSLILSVSSDKNSIFIPSLFSFSSLRYKERENERITWSLRQADCNRLN